MSTTTDTHTPVACTLGAGDYRQRMQEIHAVGVSTLRSRTRIPGGARLTFADDPGVRARLEAIIAAESSCCSFLDMRLTGDDRGLRLDITGPPEAAPIIEDLFA